MIIVKLKGGLGNQMFEYAFARSIQEETGHTKLILDISDYRYDGKRNYALKNFKLNKHCDIDDSGQYNHLYDRRSNILLKIGCKIFPNLQFDLLTPKGIYIWEDIKYKNFSVDPSQKRILLSGLWQSEKYFKSIETLIKKELMVMKTPSSRNCQMIKRINQLDSVCVHIRRSDFLHSTNNLINCSNRYYMQGMEYIEQYIKDPVYFIFSDDMKDVKKNFDFGNRNLIYIDYENYDYEELQLMYNCKHYIIANSTFSWWASLLSKNENKIIVAPQIWYSDNTEISQLIRDEWMLMNPF